MRNYKKDQFSHNLKWGKLTGLGSIIMFQTAKSEIQRLIGSKRCGATTASTMSLLEPKAPCRSTSRTVQPSLKSSFAHNNEGRGC
jgi:hypothetical protein